MTYHNLQDCVRELEQHGKLISMDDPVDARLEAAEIHRRVFQSGGPAILFRSVKNCQFPMVSNLFGTMERTRFIFRTTLDCMRRLVELKVDPASLAKGPWKYGRAALSAWRMLPRYVRTGPAVAFSTQLDQLPQQMSWPLDGGPFITLPIVYSEDIQAPGWRRSNLGMYRVQLAGNAYEPNRQVGLHYQIHRGIGVHHTHALAAGKPLQVNIFVGGAPAMAVSAVMPLPEGMSELSVGGVLSGSRIPLIRQPSGLPIYGEADFCICGELQSELLPEGPFGDHLGYYSLQHDFPVLRVKQVFHRPGAIWPFTVVGRPPQEDSMFGELVHEISGPVVPTLIPGLRAVHAVDAAGVHPLLLAIGSERYRPYGERTRPMELLTQANAILGQGQLSLAKYLLIVADQDQPKLNIHDIPAFLRHLLERVDWERDLHFQTATTIDTLDYNGTALNEGSKVVIAAVGAPRRALATSDERRAAVAQSLGMEARTLPDLPGVLVLGMPPHPTISNDINMSLANFCRRAEHLVDAPECPLWILVDNALFASASLDNLIWVTFTRSDPARDIDGLHAAIHDKHWGCRGNLVIDARKKGYHAPPLESDPDVTSRVDAMAARGGPLAKWL
jgi:4-hydroxy-3-polyprenylbenzoate decarboxylase